MASGVEHHESEVLDEGSTNWMILREDKTMLNLLWGVALVFFVLWMLGFALHFTLGGFVHVLLVLAVISVLVRIIAGRRTA